MATPSTYEERFTRMLYMCGPQSWASLLASPSEVAAAAALVASAAAPAAHVDAAELARATRLRDAVLHPDSGEPIPLLFRMAAHVPVNTALLVGMLSATSPAATGAWQFANASFNAAQFYANRNRSNPVSDGALAASYVAAMGASVGVGAGLRRYFNAAAAAAAKAAASPAAGWRGRAAAAGGAAVPFIAAATGKPFQIGFMRGDELRDGVAVYDGDGVVRGVSVAAGRDAVGMTVAVRVAYLAPMLWLPALQAGMVRAVPVLARSAPAYVASYAVLAGLHSAFVTPACMAVFDQRASLPVGALEPQFHGLVDGGGRAVERLYFNKGL